MFTTELVLMAAGLAIAFFSQGQRRTLFHSAIAIFLVALALGSVPLVIGGIAILGMGMIEGSLTNESFLRAKVYASTAVVLLAAIVLPTMTSTQSNSATTTQAPPTAMVPNSAMRPNGSLPSAGDLLQLNQQDFMQLISENREVVNGIAQDIIGDARKRVAKAASQSDGLDLETTINFKAPAELLNAAINRPSAEGPSANGSPTNTHLDLVHAPDVKSTNANLKIHATFNDAKTCNQCHQVGATPLHAQLSYEWNVDDEIESSKSHSIPLDPELMVHAN
jgi:uncharacterized membrane protein YidH (DUF202 family)